MFVLEIHYKGEAIRNITMPEIKDISALEFSVKVASSMDEYQGRLIHWPKVHKAEKPLARWPTVYPRQVQEGKKPSKRNKKD